MDEMNREQALHARDVGAKHLREGNYVKAAKLLEKSISMYSTPEALALLAKAKRGPPPATPAPGAAANAARKRHAAAAAAARAPAEDTRPYTADQLRVVKKITTCKDLYTMLEVSRDADDATIKKAYRKQAVKVHPDKNSAPGAEEAFKQIGKAFSILSNANDRAHYDRTGETSSDAAQNFARRYHQEDFDPSDIFREVFGANFAGMGGPGVRRYHFGSGPGFRNQRGGGTAQQTEPNSPLGSLVQLLPLLLLFLMSFASMPGMAAAQPWSFKQSGQFPVRRATGDVPEVAPQIPFFVSRDFHRTHGRSFGALREVERSVQASHVREMERQCGNDKLRRQRAMTRARQKGDREAERVEFEREFPSCQEVDRIYAYVNSGGSRP